MPGLFAPPPRTHGVRRPRPQQRYIALLALASTLLLSVLPTLAYAQALPPNRFYGSAKINGNDAPEGTVVEAYIGNTLCGSGTVQSRNNTEQYFVDALSGTQKPGCAKDGDTVKFKVAGLDAKETGKYATAAATNLNLTASGTPHNSAPPTVLAPGQGGTPLTPLATPAPTEAPTVPATPAATVAATGTAAAAASETPAASATATPQGSATATATATATPSLVSPAARPAPKRSGTPAWVWIIPIAVLVLAALVALAIYWRRQQA